jgi:predicted Ser/Thr protein kinase
MEDFKSIKVTKGIKSLVIDNPTSFPLIGKGSQGAVFKLSDEKCVKIYTDTLQAKMEAEALHAGQHLPFLPKLFETGPNYTVMEYFDAPTLKEYLRNCTYIPESITRKLLSMLRDMEKAKFTMIDAPLRHIFVLENEELKVVDHVNAFKRIHPVPLKLLRDLNIILLKESFLSRVKQLEPDTYDRWDRYFTENRFDYKHIPVTSGGSGKGVKVESSVTQPLIGKGHQGAVYRIAEDQCVKIYGKPEHCKQEQDVLLSNQHLSFIPKVHETGSNYVRMEYLLGPNLNQYLKKQSHLSEEITRRLLDILLEMKKAYFKQIDAPLRHIFVTNQGFKLVDHVYSYSREQDRPIELFQNLNERGFLDSFLEQVKKMDPNTYAQWTKTPIPLQIEEEMIDLEFIQNQQPPKRPKKRKKVRADKK